MALAIICASKKGVSAKQLQRQLGLGSYQSAWHMAHRIRHAMSKEPLKGMLSGRVEVDEAYVGGKPRPGNNEPRKTGRGTRLWRWSSVTVRFVHLSIEGFNAKTLKKAVCENVHEWAAYQGLGKEFKGGHLR